MAKSLTDKLRSLGKGVRNTILVGTALAGIGLAGCKLPGGPDPIVTNPQVALTVDPISGTNPSRTVIVNGTDSGGDIVNYQAFADYNNNKQVDNGELIDSKPTPINGQYLLNRGNFKIYGQVRDSQGNIDKKSLDVVVSDPPQPGYVNISNVFLEDDETHTRQNGEIKVYDTRIQNADGTFTYSDPIEDRNHPGQFEFFISASGSSSFSLKKSVTPSDTIYLRAVSGNPSSSNPKDYSYTRTIDLPAIDNDLSSGSDVRTNPIRVTPHFDLNGNSNIEASEVNNFKAFMRETNGSADLIKYNIHNIDILTKGLDLSTFDSNDQPIINSNINEWNNAITNNGIISNRPRLSVYTNNPTPYSTSAGGYINSKDGWLIIVPDKTGLMPSLISDNGGQWFFGGTDISTKTYLGGTIYLQSVFSAGVSHELGHALAFSEHSVTLGQNDSRMYYLVNSLSSPSFADKEGVLIKYEETYQGGENLNNILGTSF